MGYSDITKNCYTAEIKSTNDKLKAGTHSITAEFMSNTEEYGWSQSKPVEVTIEKNRLTLTLSGFTDGGQLDLKNKEPQTIDIKPTVTGEDGLTPSSDDLSTLTYNVYWKKSTMNDYSLLDTTKPPIAMDLEMSDTATYYFYAEILENDKYYGVKSPVYNVTVIDTREVETVMSISVDNGGAGYYPTSNITITATVKNKNTGETLDSSEQAKIDLEIKEGSYTPSGNYVDGNTVTRRFNAGGYTVVASYEDSSKHYTKCSATATFTIDKLSTSFNNVNVSPATLNAGDSVTASATLKDSKNNLISGQDVKLTITGLSTREATTDSSGNVSFSIPLTTPNDYSLQFVFDGGMNYNNCNSSVKTVTVKNNKSGLTLLTDYSTFYQGWSIAVKLSTGSGSALAGQTIKFVETDENNNIKQYSTVTDNDGIAKLTLNYSSNRNYSYTVTFEGSGTYQGDSLTKSISYKTIEEVTKQAGFVTQQKLGSQQQTWNLPYEFNGSNKAIGNSNGSTVNGGTVAEMLNNHFLRTNCLNNPLKGNLTQPATLIFTKFNHNIPSDATVKSIIASWNYMHHNCYSTGEYSSSESWSKEYGKFDAPSIRVYDDGIYSGSLTSTNAWKPQQTTWTDIKYPDEKIGDISACKYYLYSADKWNIGDVTCSPNDLLEQNSGFALSFAPNTQTSNGGSSGVMLLDCAKLTIRYIPKQPSYI